VRQQHFLFFRQDVAPIKVKIGAIEIMSKSTIHVLGVFFDSKLNWTGQVSHSVDKSSKSLNAIESIK
jgi:hypothetical protein